MAKKRVTLYDAAPATLFFLQAAGIGLLVLWVAGFIVFAIWRIVKARRQNTSRRKEDDDE